MTNLHEEIERLIESRLKHANATGEEVDLTVWVEDVAESLADIIVFGAPEELQTRMLRHAIRCLKSFVEQNQQMLKEEARKKQLQ